MPAKKPAAGNTGNKRFLTVLIYLLHAAALYTFAMSAIQVDLPPVVKENWSPLSITKTLPQAFTQKETKWPRIKLDHDFMDVLLRIIPQNHENDPKKKSLPFILGILVPVSLIVTYLIIAFGFLMIYGGKGQAMKFFAGLGSVTAGYALAGTFYLGKSAEKAFNESVQKVSEQFLGPLTKNLVQKITIEPDQGLYALFFLMLAIFAVQCIRE